MSYWFYIWVGITALALVIEFITTDLVCVWFVGGGIVAIILSACGLEWYIHLPAFIVVSSVLLISFRKIALKFLLKKEEKTNAESSIGKEYTLLTSIGFNQVGTIKIGDVVWSVECKDEHQEIEQGQIVKIVAIKGNKYIVEKLDKE